MSIPSNERIAALALSLAHEFYSGPCIDCGAPGIQMHEILGRTMRSILGGTVAILGVTLAPLCQSCHRKWEKITIEDQSTRLQVRLTYSVQFMKAQTEQLIALKARWNKL